MSRSKSSPRVKICGITGYEDAKLALDLGAWAIGFIFHASSPRCIQPDAAKTLLARLPRETLAIGIFVDRPLEEVQRLVDEVGVRGVQLHGAEPPEYLTALRAELKIKAFRVGESFHVEQVEAYPKVPILLDTHRPGRSGGTGETFDWSIAKGLSKSRQLILAGGLSPENIAAAIQTVRPYAVDVSSKLESAPGKKDSARLKQLFEIISQSLKLEA